MNRTSDSYRFLFTENESVNKIALSRQRKLMLKVPKMTILCSFEKHNMIEEFPLFSFLLSFLYRIYFRIRF